ncbi:MAG: molybdopterin-dependent oxidoreductase [Gammaproteobacteria bacterium]|nr:molybdopterin-dependent oxidoreductase [Gammaproteobacteria bacterium]
MKQVHGACPHDCPDTCAWQVTVDDSGRAVQLKGADGHPYTQGALCAKLKRYTERVYSPERVLYPHKRTGAKGSGEFKRISWDEAISEMVTRLKDSIARHGPLTAMPCNFAGTIGVLQRYAGDQFFARLGATDLDKQICGNVAYNAVASTIGAGPVLLPEDLEHSRLILIWGTNTVATNVHLWGGAIAKARKRGAQVVVIDPVRTPTAAHADWHVQLKPATDAALALGMMHVIVRDGLHDADYIARHTLGFEALCERLKEFPPSRVADITGLDVADIEKLAHQYASARPAALRLMVGMERYSNGSLGFRAVACLPALTGAWRELGGGICHFTGDLFHAALDYGAVLAPRDTPAPARSVHLAQLGRALTDPGMAPPITWMLVYNLNPVVTLPNQNLVIEGLKREDLFTVVHEQFMTDTAHYADIVLPATTQYEQWELMGSWGQTYLAINPPAIAPLGEAVANSELFRRLSRALGFSEAHLHWQDEERIRRLLASGHPYLDGITFESLMDSGWAKLALPADWRPRAEGGFTTASGKCEFYSEALAAAGHDPLPNYTPLPDTTPGTDTLPLRLVSAKTSHFLNSGYVNLPHAGTRKHRPEIQLHPADATRRAIASGDRVRMFNTLGAVEAVARVSEDTAAGVVYLPFNWWPSSTLNGSSANALTPDGLSDLNFGSNAFDARVEVERV